MNRHLKHNDFSIGAPHEQSTNSIKASNAAAVNGQPRHEAQKAGDLFREINGLGLLMCGN